MARRFVARVSFAFLLGLAAPLYNFLIDTLLSPKPFPAIVGQAAGSIAVVAVVNTFSIGVVTYTTRQNKNARPPLMALPLSIGLLAGLLLAVFSVIGIATYPNAFAAFIVGAITGAAVGLAYTLCIPGLRQDTILKQTRRSLVIGGVTGILAGFYFFIKVMPQNASNPILFYHIMDSFVGGPVVIVTLLLSFVLGIELGDRYVEQ